MVFEIRRYTPEMAAEWNVFVAQSKNGTFLFDRRYMDYHSDRFADCSLMVYRRRQLWAVLPANRVGETICSHQGLTYGGLVIDYKVTAAEVCEAMQTINGFLRGEGVKKVVYKPVPYVYHSLPADEPLYALTEVCQARLTSRDIASVIDRNATLPLMELRRRGHRKALRQGVAVRYSDDFAAFWQLLTDNLHTKYHACPVHTLKEMTLLRDRFPDNIRLLAAFIGDEMVAGTVLYVTPHVVKTQYISASPRGKEVCALDMLFPHLLTDMPGTQRYLDMGTSAMDDSTALKLPLIFQKEGFGARAICYDTYSYEL